MGWAVAAPAISAIAGAAIGAKTNASAASRQERANREAIAAQERATQEALQFEREREQRRRDEYDRTEAEARRQWEAEQSLLAPRREFTTNMAREGLRRLGINVPLGSPGEGAPPSAPMASRSATPASVPMRPSQDLPLSQMLDAPSRAHAVLKAEAMPKTMPTTSLTGLVEAQRPVTSDAWLADIVTPKRRVR